MKKILFTLIGLSMGLLSLQAQEESSPLNVSADIMSRYVWRGVNFGGNTPSIQPGITYDFGSEKHAFTLGAWGAYSVGGNMFQEADLYLSYSFNSVASITLTDYFFPADDYSSPRYFNYKDKLTGHVFEAMASFDGTEKIPFSLLFAMNLYGADARRIKADGSDGGIMMTKYIELGYTRSIGNTEFNIFVGATPDDPNEKLGETGFYRNISEGVINTGIKISKEIKINDKFSLPVHSQLIINPESESIFLVFGFSL